MSAFLDTNILLYAAGIDVSGEKLRIAYDLLNCGERFVLSVQVLNEFVVQATKQSRANAVSVPGALDFVRTLREFEIVGVDLALFDRAASVQSQTGYSWWDSLIVAAAITAGCDTLLTEDLQHGRVIDGVRIVNPFRELA